MQKLFSKFFFSKNNQILTEFFFKYKKIAKIIFKIFLKNFSYGNFFLQIFFWWKFFLSNFFWRKFFFSQKYFFEDFFHNIFANFFCIWCLLNNVFCEIFYSKFCLLRIFLCCNFEIFFPIFFQRWTWIPNLKMLAYYLPNRQRIYYIKSIL